MRKAHEGPEPVSVPGNVARLPRVPLGPEDEVTVTQEAIHVIRMSAKVPPLAPDHIRQARSGRVNVSPP